MAVVLNTLLRLVVPVPITPHIPGSRQGNQRSHRGHEGSCSVESGLPLTLGKGVPVTRHGHQYNPLRGIGEGHQRVDAASLQEVEDTLTIVSLSGEEQIRAQGLEGGNGTTRVDPREDGELVEEVYMNG